MFRMTWEVLAYVTLALEKKYDIAEFRLGGTKKKGRFLHAFKKVQSHFYTPEKCKITLFRSIIVYFDKQAKFVAEQRKLHNFRESSRKKLEKCDNA